MDENIYKNKHYIIYEKISSILFEICHQISKQKLMLPFIDNAKSNSFQSFGESEYQDNSSTAFSTTSTFNYDFDEVCKISLQAAEPVVTQQDQQIPSENAYSQSANIINSNLLGISDDPNKNIYEDHIGCILFYLDHTQNDHHQEWKKKIIGTGTIIGKNTVLTTAYALHKLLKAREFSQGRIRFRLTNSEQKFYKVSEIRLMTDYNIAILLLNDLNIQPKICLIVHNKRSKDSMFHNRKFYCQVIGFPILSKNFDWKLKKSEGYIFIKQFNHIGFRFGLSTGEGAQGGVIIFFPTGKYSQPFILGINSESTEPIQYYHYKRQYYKQKYNHGKKYIQDSFIHEKSCFITYYSKQDYFQKYGEKITSIFSISQNNFMFTEGIFQMNKWSFIMNINDLWAQHRQINIYWSLYREIIEYLKHDLYCVKIDPQNMLCFDTRKDQFHPLFDTKVTNIRSSPEKEVVQVKRAFLKTINQYKRRISTIDLFKQILSCINGSQQNFSACFLQQLQQMSYKVTHSSALIQIKYQQYQKDLQKIDLISQCKSLAALIQYLDNQQSFDLQKQTSQEEHVHEIDQKVEFVQEGSQFFRIFFNRINQLKAYMKYFEKVNQYTEEILRMSKIMLMKKIAIKITYELFEFCYQNYLKINNTPHKIFSINPNNNDWSFAKQFHKAEVATVTVKSKYKNEVERRYNQLCLIERIVNMDLQKRQRLIRRILKWNELKKNWHRFLSYLQPRQRPIDNSDVYTQMLKQIQKIYLTTYDRAINPMNYNVICITQIDLFHHLFKQQGFEQKLENEIENMSQ